MHREHCPEPSRHHLGKLLGGMPDCAPCPPVREDVFVDASVWQITAIIAEMPCEFPVEEERHASVRGKSFLEGFSETVAEVVQSRVGKFQFFTVEDKHFGRSVVSCKGSNKYVIGMHILLTL